MIADPEIPRQQEDTPYRSLRCGACYWVLYDGRWCQNPDCIIHEPKGNVIRLSNKEAAARIRSKFESS